MAVTATTDVLWDQNAWEQRAYYALRPELYWDQFARVKATNETHKGAGVIFDFENEMASSPTPLTELTDVTPATIGDTQLTVTLAEYGNAAQSSAKIRGTSYLPVDPVIANLIGYNAGLSIDDVALAVVQAGTQVRLTAGVAGRTSLGLTNNITRAEVAYMVAKLRGQNVKTFDGQGYAGFIHPDVSYDLRNQTTGGTWRDAMQYTTAGIDRLYNAFIGKFEGVMWMESPRTPLFVNASNGAGAAGTIDVYGTMVMGEEAVAKAYSKADGYGPDPRIVVSPVVDRLRRFTGLGWYHLVGYSVFRQAALYRQESVSTIGTN